MKLFVAALGMVALPLTSAAAAHPLQAPLSGLSFLLGQWTSGDHGKVADTGGSSMGSSTITSEANGAVLLRRDHVDLLNQAGAPAGSFDIIMMIYPEGGQIHAEYADGTHLIHYASATIEPGHAVTFTSAARPGAPVFKLSYTVANPATLDVSFAMIPPGGAPPHLIATGTLVKSGK